MNNLLDYAVTINALKGTPVETIGVFPKGYVSLIAGEPGVGKTWLTLSICRGIADGVHGLGMPFTQAYPQGRVLLFAGETGVGILSERMQLLGGLRNLKNLAIISSHLMMMNNIDVSLHSKQGLENIEQAIQAYKPSIVFFDTLISFIGDGKDESSQADMTEAIRRLSIVATATKCAIVIVHHFRKRRKDADISVRDQNAVIGSSALTRLPALVMSLERRGNMRMCRCLKSWWEEFSAFGFKLKGGNGHVEIVEDYNFDSEGNIDKGSAIVRALEYLRENFSQDNFTTTQVLAQTKLGEGSIREAIRQLRATGEIKVVETSGRMPVFSFDKHNVDDDSFMLPDA